ncbi:MAG: hypothetical protein LBT14_11735 [Treponema sp.]|jgi:hypothetical protein|nr:hypothetical protein [Treponema sp.]
MKKLLCMTALVFSLLIPGFAQTKHRFAATLDPVPLIVGPLFGGFGIAGSFEWVPNALFSARIDTYYLGVLFENKTFYYEEDSYDHQDGYVVNEITGSYFKVFGEGRYYPLKTAPQGLFLDLGFGFMILAVDNSYPQEEDTAFQTFFGGLGLGYKIIFNRKSRVAFFLEPSIKYHVPFSMDREIRSISGVLLGVWGFGAALTLGLTF